MYLTLWFKNHCDQRWSVITLYNYKIAFQIYGFVVLTLYSQSKISVLKWYSKLKNTINSSSTLFFGSCKMLLYVSCTNKWHSGESTASETYLFLPALNKQSTDYFSGSLIYFTFVVLNKICCNWLHKLQLYIRSSHSIKSIYLIKSYY